MMHRGVANKYALALFRTLKDKDKRDKVLQEFEELKTFLHENEDIKRFLFNYPVKEELKKQVVQDVAAEYSPEFIRFLLLLIEKKRFNLLEMIKEDFKRRVDDDKGIVTAELSTPFALDEEQKEKIKLYLEEDSGKKVEIKENIVPEIKAGFIIRIGDKVFDASIKMQLQKLYKKITA